jgi:hypothetical protein
MGEAKGSAFPSPHEMTNSELLDMLRSSELMQDTHKEGVLRSFDAEGRLDGTVSEWRALQQRAHIRPCGILAQRQLDRLWHEARGPFALTDLGAPPVG